jgi:hypothetical protein
MMGGLGLLGAATGVENTVFLSPHQGAALIVVTPAMLLNPYHLRYEIIEFAVVTLITRVQALVPLHAACFGRGDRGLLLMGDSGAGKSTVALQAILNGWDFVAEDAAFVAARQHAGHRRGQFSAHSRDYAALARTGTDGYVYP